MRHSRFVLCLLVLSQCLGGLSYSSLSHAASEAQMAVPDADCPGHHTDSASGTSLEAPASPDDQSSSCCDTLACKCAVGHMPAVVAEKAAAIPARTDLRPGFTTPLAGQHVSELFRPPI